VWKILAMNDPDVSSKSEIELDLDKLPIHLLDQLYCYAKDKIASYSNPVISTIKQQNESSNNKDQNIDLKESTKDETVETAGDSVIKNSAIACQIGQQNLSHITPKNNTIDDKMDVENFSHVSNIADTQKIPIHNENKQTTLMKSTCNNSDELLGKRNENDIDFGVGINEGDPNAQNRKMLHTDFDELDHNKENKQNKEDSVISEE